MRRKQIESDEPTEDNQPKLYLGNKQPRVQERMAQKRSQHLFRNLAQTIGAMGE
jgi:hypothetical protein